MGEFESREQAFEAKFAHDQELQFKAKARRDALMARWVVSELGQCGGGLVRIGVIEGLQHQFPAAALACRRAQALRPVHDPGDQPMIVQAEPASPCLPVEARDDPGPVGPVTARRQPRAPGHFVAVGAEDDRPVMARAAEDDDAAHERKMRR